MSSSAMLLPVRSRPHPNSSFRRSASTTEQMQSRVGMCVMGPALKVLRSRDCSYAQMVCAMGDGSQMPEASMTM